MNYKERQELREKVANKLTDNCPLEALMMHFYSDQMAWLEEMRDEELINTAEEILNDK